uniref:Dual-specificity phosphatase n=1 Tax=Clandestinovirus TaxID=2831644 RepID=A0A8F8KTD3_9VIRU|nr:dual-specificity phosphatase [Clandestinovirus]
MQPNVNAEAHEIVPGLWLGSAKAAEDIKFLRSKGISAIVNATKDLPFYHADPRVDREYTRIDVDDNLQKDQIERMFHMLSHATGFVHKNHRMQNKAVLIHCFAGIQRSACITAAYLMKYYDMSLKQAIVTVVSKRPVAFYRGINFLQTLKWWEQTLKQKCIQ